MEVKIKKKGKTCEYYVDNKLLLVTPDNTGLDSRFFEAFCNSHASAIHVLTKDDRPDEDRFIPSDIYDFISIVKSIKYAMHSIYKKVYYGDDSDEFTPQLYNSSFMYSHRPQTVGLYLRTIDNNGDEMSDDDMNDRRISTSELSLGSHIDLGYTGNLVPTLTVYDFVDGRHIIWLNLNKSQYNKYKELDDSALIYSDLSSGVEPIDAIYKEQIDFISLYEDGFDEIPFDI